MQGCQQLFHTAEWPSSLIGLASIMPDKGAWSLQVLCENIFSESVL